MKYLCQQRKKNTIEIFLFITNIITFVFLFFIILEYIETALFFKLFWLIILFVYMINIYES